MDGELDLVRRLEVERHLQTCSECATHVSNGRNVRTILRSDRLYYGAPRELQSSVLSAVRIAEQAQMPRTRLFVRPAMAIAACVALVAMCWLVFAQVRRANREALVMQQVTCGHVHSLMANHLLDIASADPVVVKPWFSGRLDYAPPVVDLTRQGYPLLGGRLDYLNDRTVSAVVYTRQKHVINLFLWPTNEPDSPSLLEESRLGYHLCRWTMNSMTYCAVSDLSPQELALFAASLRTHLTPIEIEHCK